MELVELCAWKYLCRAHSFFSNSLFGECACGHTGNVFSSQMLGLLCPGSSWRGRSLGNLVLLCDCVTRLCLTWKWDQMLDASDKLIISSKLCCIYCAVRKQRSCFFLQYLHLVTKGLKWLRFISISIYIYFFFNFFLIKHWVIYSILSHLSVEFFRKRHPVRCSRQSYEKHWYC